MFCLKRVEPIVAAWPEPMPGKNEQRGATKAAVNVELINSFFDSFTLFKEDIFCFGIEILFLMLIIRADVPNKPVRRGSKGSFTGRANVKSPRNPARMNIISDLIISFSEKMRKREINIRMKGIRVFINEKK